MALFWDGVTWWPASRRLETSAMFDQTELVAIGVCHDHPFHALLGCCLEFAPAQVLHTIDRCLQVRHLEIDT